MKITKILIIFLVTSTVLAIVSVTIFFIFKPKTQLLSYPLQDLGTLQKGVGINWWFFHQDFPDEGKMIITFATDGIFIFDDISIKTADGEQLGISKVSLKGYYLDSRGQKRSVLLPILFQFPDGRKYLSGGFQAPEVNWNDNEIKSNINRLSFNLSGGTKGRLVTAVVVNNVDSYISKNNPTGIWLDKLKLIDKYNNSWGIIMDDFYISGDPRIGLIFLLDTGNVPSKVDL